MKSRLIFAFSAAVVSLGGCHHGSTVTISHNGQETKLVTAGDKTILTTPEGLSAEIKGDSAKIESLKPTPKDFEYTDEQFGIPAYPGSVQTPEGFAASTDLGVLSVVESRTSRDNPDLIEKFYRSKYEGLSFARAEDDGRISIMGSGKVNGEKKLTITITRDKKGQNSLITVIVGSPAAKKN